MNGALNEWRLAVAEQLRERGLNVVTAMEGARTARWREAVVAVSLSGVVCAAGGFQDDLGVWTDPASGKERELYGREVELTLALDVFAPRDGGESVCQRAAETVTEFLVCRGAAGVAALEVRAGRVEFLETEGLYRQEISCRCRAWLAARMDDEAGAFVDFEVKGRLK